MSIHHIEQELADARERLDRALQALAPKRCSGEVEEARAAEEAMLQLERRPGALKGEEHAVPLDFPVECDKGAPLPHLLRNERRTFLIYYASEHDPPWDGTHVNVRDTAAVAALASVEFIECKLARLGAPNDETHREHPLWGKGSVGGCSPYR